MIVTASSIGLTWDEPFYIKASHSYAEWFAVLTSDPIQALQPETIDSYWYYNSEHPPLFKVWSGFIWLAGRDIFDPLTADRLGSIFLTGILAALLYLMTSETYGRAAGLFAVAALLTLPRFFLHAHLTALDVPISAAWFAFVFIFWKTVDRKGWGWGLLWGLSWGLATAVKLNGVFIPLGIIVWVLLFRRTRENAVRFFVMVPVAVGTFFLVWPWLYFQTWERVAGYIQYHLNHEMQGQWYLGQVFSPPPWHFVFVILWAVVPLTFLALFLAGIVRSLNWKQDQALGWLLILNILAVIFPFLSGKFPIYDNERLFMPVFPFMAALTGIGFGWLANTLQKLAIRINRPGWAVPAVWILGFVLLLPQSLSIARLYPHLLSYYSESVGGLPGATRMGLESTYWCETFLEALPYINSRAKPGDLIWAEDTQFAADSVLDYYQENGLLRKDIEISRFPADEFPENADWFVYQHRQSQYGPDGEENYSLYQTLKNRDPVYELNIQGIPLMGLYGRLE